MSINIVTIENAEGVIDLTPIKCACSDEIIGWKTNPGKGKAPSYISLRIVDDTGRQRIDCTSMSFK